MLRFENVTKRYPDGTEAVKDLTLDVKEGEVVVLIGPSGCGKTTTGRSILRLIEPTSGRIVFDGVDMAQLDRTELRHKRKHIQAIFQDLVDRPELELGVSQEADEQFHGAVAGTTADAHHGRVGAVGAKNNGLDGIGKSRRFRIGRNGIHLGKFLGHTRFHRYPEVVKIHPVKSGHAFIRPGPLRQEYVSGVL